MRNFYLHGDPGSSMLIMQCSNEDEVEYIV